VAAGGYVVVDDYHAFAECGEAVRDYLAAEGLAPALTAIDEEAVFWMK
jgi:hypothetical protein